MRGGQQVGGPLLKALLSRLAGLSLHWFARVGTRDATNSLQGVLDRRSSARSASTAAAGFEIGIELDGQGPPAPAARSPRSRRSGSTGTSARPNFKVAAWIPRYLRWYRFAFGPQLTLEQVRATGAIASRQRDREPS